MSLPLKRNAAATLKAAIAPRAHQLTQDWLATCDQNFSATRGGVIARVWISIRQKSNRPLRCISADNQRDSETIALISNRQRHLLRYVLSPFAQTIQGSAER